MSVFGFLKKDGEKKKSSYLTGREIKEIAKANQKEMRRLEKEKRRPKLEEEYLSEMKGENNILEIEKLHS